jgi:hypothetical protein
MEDRGAELALCGIARRCLGVTAIERYRALQEKADAAAQPGANSSGSSMAKGATTSGCVRQSQARNVCVSSQHSICLCSGILLSCV